jgi:murein DD-endopeptidase MepM/ murein hydrolase activator NlpD
LRRAAVIVLLIALFAAGWIGGDRYGLPDGVRERIDTALGDAARRGEETAQLTEDYLKARLEEARSYDFDMSLQSLPDDVTAEELVIGRKKGVAAEDLPDDPEEAEVLEETAEGEEAPAPDTPVTSLATLRLCPGMDVANAPRTDGKSIILGLRERVTVRGVSLRTTPVSEGCLSSAFGPRSGKLHKGADFNHPIGSAVMAAAGGTVLEAAYRDDYGHYVLIGHGDGVHTRYAHLRKIAPGLGIGSKVADGQTLGTMGKSGGWPMPIHLHYEVLVGDYDTPKKAFGLTPLDPLTGRGGKTA